MAIDPNTPLELDDFTTGELAKLAFYGIRITARGATTGQPSNKLVAKSDRIIAAARTRRDQRQK